MTRSTDVHREAWVNRAREADLLTTAQRHGATLKRLGREHTGPCPACGGTDRFSINPVKSKWHCRGHGGGGDAIGMVCHIAGLSFLQAIEDITGEPPPSGPAKPLSAEQQAERARQRQKNDEAQARRKAQEAAYLEDTREAAQAIWNRSVAIEGTLAETYLRSRGIGLDQWPDVLRFHGALPYPNKPGTYPALVARVDDLGGDLTAIWRIFLRADAHKLDVENAKLGLGPAGGGAVRLGGMASHIGVAEGLETALAASLLTGGKVPIWASLSTAGMIGLEVPLGVSRISIFPDGDNPLRRKGHEYEPAIPAGRKAAQSLFARLTVEGIRASIAAEPPPGQDWLDMWNQSQREVA